MSSVIAEAAALTVDPERGFGVLPARRDLRPVGRDPESKAGWPVRFTLESREPRWPAADRPLIAHGAESLLLALSETQVVGQCGRERPGGGAGEVGISTTATCPAPRDAE